MSALTAELRPHPQSPCKAVRRIGIGIGFEADPGVLQVRFRIEGDIDRLVLPTAGFARRSDGLWQHTCFEAFLRPDANDSYHEFNFGLPATGRRTVSAPGAAIAAFRNCRHRPSASAPTGIVAT